MLSSLVYGLISLKHFVSLLLIVCDCRVPLIPNIFKDIHIFSEDFYAI